MTLYSELRKKSKIVVDSSELSTFRHYFHLSGVTTNPTLIIKGYEANEFPDLVYEATKKAKNAKTGEGALELAQDWLLVLLADRLSEYADGKISIELDARLSFDTLAMCERAQRIIDLCRELGLSESRVLIKIASTWEGIYAAKWLEERDINCNMTLLFDLYQAIACAQAQVTLISPFVGRIYDWYLAKYRTKHIPIAEDPGVLSVKRMYAYFKKNKIATDIMAASFRSVEQIEALAGCDLLTVSPHLIDQMDKIQRTPAGSIEDYKEQTNEPDFDTPVSEQSFRWHLNENAMASEKLAQGIRLFAEDQRKLEQLLQPMLV